MRQINWGNMTDEETLEAMFEGWQLLTSENQEKFLNSERGPSIEQMDEAIESRNS